MKLSVEDHYHATVLSVKGKFLGSIDGAEYKDTIDALNAQGKTRLVVDFAEADLLDSTAIGLLIAGVTTLRRAGGDIRLANLKTRLRNLFLMTRLLGSVFESYDSREEALESFLDHAEPEATLRP